MSSIFRIIVLKSIVYRTVFYMIEINASFGQRLRELMKENDTTQVALAGAIGYSQRSVSKWINFQSEPTATAIVRCARYFDVTCGYILGTED